MEKVHHQIRLRILSCGRMSENHRGPEVPEGRVPSGRMSRWPCKDYLRGTCNNSFCERWHPPECLFYKTKSGCRFGEKCSFAHRQVDAQPTKWSKSNNDKSAVERESVSDGCHDRTGKPVKRGDEKLGRNSSKRQFLMHDKWLRISGHEAAEVHSPEGHRHAETNPTCEVHKGYCTSYQKFETKIPRSVTFVQVNLMSVAPTLRNLRIVHKKRQSGKRKVPAKQRGSWPKMCLK